MKEQRLSLATSDKKTCDSVINRENQGGLPPLPYQTGDGFLRLKSRFLNCYPVSTNQTLACISLRTKYINPGLYSSKQHAPFVVNFNPATISKLRYRTMLTSALIFFAMNFSVPIGLTRYTFYQRKHAGGKSKK